MKKSEIETIISQNPETVFTENVKYAMRKFIIVGFEQVKKDSYTAPTTVALVKDVWFSTSTSEVNISDKVRQQTLRNIIATNHITTDAYKQAKIQQAHNKELAKQKHDRAVELMNDIKPELKAALNACGVDNLQYNFGTMAATFKIEVDLDNAEQLLKVLQAFAAQQVTA